MNIVSLIKVIAMNALRLPDELIGVIKEYAFYDKSSLSYIKKMSSYKKPVNDTIKRAWSRNNPQGIFNSEEDQDTVEHWFFGFGDADDVELLTLQNNHCSRCGNYQIIGETYLFRHCRKNVPHIMCCCPTNIYYGWDNQDEIEDFDNDSEYEDFEMDD